MGHRHRPTRREFLQTAGAAIAAPYVITSSALGNADVPPASDRIVMGGIGIVFSLIWLKVIHSPRQHPMIKKAQELFGVSPREIKTP